jgi:hypothetical protein
MTAAAASEDRRVAIEVVAWAVLIACILAALTATGLSALGPGTARLCKTLVRVPAAKDLLFDRHWRAAPQASRAGPASPACLTLLRVDR